MIRLLRRWLQAASEPAETYQQREYREATERWRVHNAEARAAGCQCGKPATHVTYDHRNVGAVPVEFWTCDEHFGVNAWSGNQPLWDRAMPCPPCEYRGGDRHCAGWMGPIGGPPRVWHCPDRPPPTSTSIRIIRAKAGSVEIEVTENPELAPVPVSNLEQS